METRNKSNQTFHEDLLKCGFSSCEIKKRCVQDVREEAARMKRVLSNYAPQMARAILTYLETGENQFDENKHPEARDVCESLAGLIQERISDYPPDFRLDVIEQVRQDLPDMDIETNDERDRERAFDEWAALTNYKSGYEIRDMISKVKGVMNLV
jgi:hypothetical protein